MSLSIHSLTVPVFVRAFHVLSALLDKAETHATETGVPLDELFTARLAPDMLPLSGQIQRASDTAKSTIGRLSAIELPKFADEEATFADLHTRIDKTVAFLETVTPEDLDDGAARDVALSFGKLKTSMKGDEYLVKFALPNFYFHVVTTHDILRHKGVPVGKRDYLGPFDLISD